MSRSGYYKWRARDKTPPLKRRKILELVRECHERHPSHGYRWVHAWISRRHGDLSCSPDYVRKCFSCLGISAQTKRKPGARGRPRKTGCPFPNLIFSTWDTVDRPRQVVVSDMTSCWVGRSLYLEMVFYFDVYTKQIVGHGIGHGRGGSAHYYAGLRRALGSVERARERAVGQLEEGCGEICVFHTDQGSVYTSMAYNEIIREAGIVRSCSRAGKPTDNPVNESLNGWIKEELIGDFGLGGAKSLQEAAEIIDGYVRWYNAERPCWAIGYKTPDELYEGYMAGEVEARDTFASRKLDPTPKFVRERLAAAEGAAAANGGIGSSDPLLHDGGVYGTV